MIFFKIQNMIIVVRNSTLLSNTLVYVENVWMKKIYA